MIDGVERPVGPPSGVAAGRTGTRKAFSSVPSLYTASLNLDASLANMKTPMPVPTPSLTMVRARTRLGRPALAVSKCGETAKAEELAAETSQAFPKGTTWIAVSLPEIQAMIALRGDDPAASIELMQSASPCERADSDAIYVRGFAYRNMHRGAEAAAEFHKIVGHKGAHCGRHYSLVYLGRRAATHLKATRPGL
jgi:hypothetical protein